MDADVYTTGTCKHGRLYEAGCEICENQHEARTTRVFHRLRVRTAREEDTDLLRRCLEALTCDEADPDDPGHRCGACDEYVDRNRILRNELQERLK